MKRQGKRKALHEHYTKGSDDECWLWQGGKDSCGYGRFMRSGKEIKAHREMYELFKGPIPVGAILLHSCDNPACVNPSHLTPGTHVANQQDKFMKGRQAMGETVASARLSEEQVREMRDAYQFRKCTYKDLAAKYGVHKDTARKAIRGINWSHLA